MVSVGADRAAACETAGVNERAVEDLRELARHDASLADGARRLHDLDGQVAALRARAETIDAFFTAYPEEEARRREESDAAAAEV